MAVWEDHLLPQLTCKDAARLGCSCKALRGVVREHFKEIGTIGLKTLRAALTTFPRARSVTPHSYDYEKWRREDMEALLQWLCEGGRGRHLATVRLDGEAAFIFTYVALRLGALPSLKAMSADLKHRTARAFLTDGFFGGMHELRLSVNCRDDLQVAALGLVQQLPALTKLDVDTLRPGYSREVPTLWPPFIPPSLKALRFGSANRSLLRALPGMLEASGARLEGLEVHIPPDFSAIGDGLVHVAQALRCCSPSLKSFLLGPQNEDCILFVNKRSQDYASQVERLRMQWAEVLAGVSACRELQVLVLPRIEVEPLLPPGTAFGRLTHLQISDYEREHPPGASVMGVWELVASGGLPALAKLKVTTEGRRLFGREVRSRVAPALEAVAGTLTHLNLSGLLASDEMEAGYEWGLAVGKLRRLKDLALSLSADGRVYHAFAPGPGR
jgi:hypothetical protein